ncbi:MAG: hypothetical protein LCH85_13560 [Chloroflexi bacterium]|nr:hypothetical protein [Chloroflexota bacterium]
MATQAPTKPVQAQRSWLLNLLSHRGVQLTIFLWIIGHGLIILLSDGALPFDRPAFAGSPFVLQMFVPSVMMLEIFVLMGLGYMLTRNRPVIDVAARAPERSQALRETLGLVAYAVFGQALGWVLGPLLGFQPFSFHLAGTLVGGHGDLSIAEVWSWAIYNFGFYAVVPYLWFRRRYSAVQLNLVSTNRRNDFLVIAVIAISESLFELTTLGTSLNRLSFSQLALGLPLSLVIYGLGTVLPTMILIYSILIPRFLKITGSAITTVLLGGVSYAVVHMAEAWTNFSTPTNGLISIIFVLISYFGAGMIKTVLTLRTGNAWVHALGYHTIAPHVIIDTPHIVKIFGIR